MILCLLAPALLLGSLASLPANVTVEEWSSAAGNQTTGTPPPANRTFQPLNATPGLDEDELSSIRSHLQTNQTSDLITEDNENFQDQSRGSGSGCNQQALLMYSHDCGLLFHKDMLSIGEDNWCVLERVIRPYNNMTLCLEQVCFLLDCFYPNPSIQDFFLQIHSFFFQKCSGDVYQPEDAPQWLVMALTLIPVSLIPVLVYVVVWMSKAQE
ncbi:receptor activity-modifying protein 3 [Aulostomus maculatus]